MPIGAILGGATLVGSVLSSNSANKNANRALQSSERNNMANVALARESRDMSLQRLDPFANRGNAAGNQINALLGLGGDMGGPQAVSPNALSQFQPAGQAYGLGDSPGFQYQGFGGNVLGNVMNAASPQGASPTGIMPSGGSVTADPAMSSPMAAQQSAFDTFRNSTGYQFRLGEGMDAVTSAYAGVGALQSGAAMRGINEYGQNFASNEFGNYLNALGAQQAVGAGAASAGAGVTQNFAGTVIDSNNFNTQNQMNAQLSKQNVFGNALGTIGGAGLGFLSGGR